MQRLAKFGKFGLASVKLFKSGKLKNATITPITHKQEQKQSIYNVNNEAEGLSTNHHVLNVQQNHKATQSITKKGQASPQLFRKAKEEITDQKIPQKQKKDQDSDPLLMKKEQKSQSKMLKLLLTQRQAMFQNKDLLPGYLDQVSAILTPQSYAANQYELIDINHKLNDFSLELGSTPLQYLAILNYRYRSRMLQSKFSEVDNHKFIHKATIVCQMLIHKQQLQLNQVIFVMQALIRMGALTVILLMNFTKYMKGVFQDQKKAAKISLEHVVTILNMGVIKRNQITIQNILYDQVLNFLLKNINNLMKNQPIWMKVQLLNLLLVTDIKRFYKIDRKSKELQTKKLFRSIINQLQTSWFQQMLQKKGQQNSKLNWKSVLSIVQAINFATEYRFQQLQYGLQFDSFISQNIDVVSSILDGENQQSRVRKLQKMSEQQKCAIVRLIFNRKGLQYWAEYPKIQGKLYKILQGMQLKKSQSFNPIVDLIYSVKNQQNKLNLGMLLQLSYQIYNHYKSSINLYALLVALNQNKVAPQLLCKEVKSLSLKQRSQDNFNNKLSLHLISKFYNKQANQITQDIKLSQEEIEEQSKKGTLITRYYEVAQNMRNLTIIQKSFGQFWKKINANNTFWQKIKKNNTMKQQNLQLLEILLYDKLNQVQLSSQLNTIIQYLIKQTSLKNAFLNHCYPPTYNYANPYHKPINIFTNTSNFTQKFKILMQYYADEKYSYYLWDLMIKSLVRLPSQMRREAYPMVQSVFLNAFQKDNLRKVVLLTVFTNHICSKTILADQKTLKNAIKFCIGELIKAEEIIEYHYQCYLQIVVNALSCDILQLETFNRIMKHTYQKSPNIKETTTLLLLYGATIYKERGMDQQKVKVKIQSQISYLKMLASKKIIVEQTSVVSEELPIWQERQNVKQRLTIYISAKLIAIYLRFGIKQLGLLQKLVQKYVKQLTQLSQWQLIVYSYQFASFPKQTPKQIQFLRKLSTLLSEKLYFFRQKGLLTSQQFEQFQLKMK